MTVFEIAGRINVHLRHHEFEMNERWPIGVPRLRHAGASAVAGLVRVQYDWMSGTVDLTEHEAARYLVLLDGGAIGRHYEVLYTNSQ